ncbi:elongation factor P maturation arginine rhamnosyltransferase EarP [Halioxenophilus sp. WMMB6]|uniref:elongation factor P maturation arginine rhamnosyltransferase EarP n=1 Tax=Halioxenophilus sp. WMMB6 TaxID=3073815 RepID=UPI00295F3EDF|nr:elongation factor P maturation arginine rhamnosyltransferase EarP [Halioxenophilus sp. WMMB6]
MAEQWHLFCRVVDNFGDIGTCWQLARTLVSHHGKAVTLWLDDLPSLAALWPGVDTANAQQSLEGVSIRHWCDPLPLVTPGDVVIEAYGCELPALYIESMAGHTTHWLNLEYLSAETWVADFHLGRSPVHGLNKTFFFPGFDNHSGGLLWEPELLALSERFREPSVRKQWRQQMGIPEVADVVTLSLFAYANVALPILLDSLSKAPFASHLLVPEGKVSKPISNWLGQSFVASNSYSRGNLQLTALPFLAQDQYDRLLAYCDFNFVRGEASFMRTQMLGKPFLWQIYPQEEGAHYIKLNAFLERYLAGAPTALVEPAKALHGTWNGAGGDAFRADLSPLLSTWQSHSLNWQKKMISLGDLASNLVLFCGLQV